MAKIPTICPVCQAEAREDAAKTEGGERWIDCPSCGGVTRYGGKYVAACSDRGPQPVLSALLRGMPPKVRTAPPAILSDWEIELRAGRVRV